jgi:hypothetical protein
MDPHSDPVEDFSHHAHCGSWIGSIFVAVGYRRLREKAAAFICYMLAEQIANN